MLQLCHTIAAILAQHLLSRFFPFHEDTESIRFGDCEMNEGEGKVAVEGNVIQDQLRQLGDTGLAVEERGDRLL